MIVQVVLLDGRACFFSMDLDGTHQKQITRPEEGFPYGLSASPDGKRIAFHSAGKPTYRVFSSNVDGSGRALVAGNPDHLYFGTSWSPDGNWILYQDCTYKTDPGHQWSDICVGKPDGSENRVLTKGQTQWFATSYGNEKHHGDGSNVPQWCPDGRILYTRKLPGSQSAWQYQAQRPDTDHFNRDFKPEEARGGTEICLLSPKDGSVTRLTHNDPPQWDFRATCSPDGKRILFCRAKNGEFPAIWVMDADGKNQRLLTRGLDDQGADFPRWLPK
jgi:TolB protein